MPSRFSEVEYAGAALGIDAAHRDGGQLSARRDERVLEHAQIRGARARLP